MRACERYLFGTGFLPVPLLRLNSRPSGGPSRERTRGPTAQISAEVPRTLPAPRCREEGAAAVGGIGCAVITVIATFRRCLPVIIDFFHRRRRFTSSDARLFRELGFRRDRFVFVFLLSCLRPQFRESETHKLQARRDQAPHCGAESSKRGQNPKMTFNSNKTHHAGVFDVADYEFEVINCPNKTADPI